MIVAAAAVTKLVEAEFYGLCAAVEYLDAALRVLIFGRAGVGGGEQNEGGGEQ